MIVKSKSKLILLLALTLLVGNIVSAQCGATLSIQENPIGPICPGGSKILTVTGAPATTTFTYGSAIFINDNAPASPYPANLMVTGLPTSGVTVRSVTLSNVSHTWTGDIDIMLQSPTGQNVILLSDFGGGNALLGTTLTFNDAAATTVVNLNPIPNGTYKCTNVGTPDNFPPPGPGSINQANPSLSLFSGNMNGMWKLFVIDQATGDFGNIGGFSITFSLPPWTFSWSPAAGLNTTTGTSVTATPSTSTTYTVTGTAPNGCQTTASIPVNISPIPNAVATPFSQTTCSGSPITTIILSGNVVGASYNWTRNNMVSVSGIPASGASNINGTLTNTTNSPVTVTFTITPTINGCAGVPTIARVVVYPIPDMNQPTSQTLCNNTATEAVNFTGSVAGTNFSWTNNNPAIGLPASGRGDIPTFVGTNNSNAPITATITVTPTVGGTYAYVPNTGADMYVINTLTNTVAAIIPVGERSYGVSVSPDGSHVYISHPFDYNISVINTADNSVEAVITVGNAPMGLAVSPDGRWVYIANVGSGNISVISTATNMVVATLPVGQIPWGVAVSPDGNHLYITQTTSQGIPGTVAVINTATYLLEATITVGSGPQGITVSPDGSKVYVANQYTNDVSVINTADNSVLATVPVGSAPHGITISPDGSRVYVTNSLSDDVSVINTLDNSVLTTIQVLHGPNGVSVTPDGSWVYVATAGGVSVINTATNTVEPASIFVGDASSFGNFITNGHTCPGAPKTFTITVNPTPVAVATPAIQTICSAEAITTIVLSSAVSGTTYTWTRDNLAAVTGIAAGGTGDISGTLTNTTNAPVTVIFTITPMPNQSCEGIPTTASVLVNPTPDVNQPSDQTLCNNATTLPVHFTGSFAGTEFNWVNNNPSIGLAASGTGYIPAFVGTNTGNVPATATITVTPIHSYGINYTSSSIPFSPLSTTGISVNLGDDEVSAAIPLGFNFNFFGNSYSQFYISSNGFITFNPASGAGCCDGQLLPDVNDPNDLIAAWWTDLYPAGGGNITYYTTGVAGSRKTVISYVNIPHCCGNDPDVTTQIILYETTDNIEIHTTHVSVFDKYATQGIENMNGTVAQVTPGRNAAPYLSASNDAVLFTPVVPTCSGPSKTFTITVDPTPNAIATPSAQTSCSGNPISTILLSSNVSGTTFNWTRNNTAAVTGIAGSGTGDIGGVLTNTTNTPVTVSFIITPVYTNAGTSCAGTPVTATVTVNPGPTITCPSNIIVNAIGNQCGAFVYYSATATGIPTPVITYSINPGSYFPAGTTTVIATATNTCGPVSCNFTVTVKENKKPVINCPGNITQNITAGCTKTITVPNPVVSDNCGLATVEWVMTGATTGNSPSTGINFVGTANFNRGVTTITYVATDVSGNVAGCNFKVTVNDAINPVITCPANINQAVTAGCSQSIITQVPVYSDNCAVTVLTWTMSGATTGQSPATGINPVGTKIFNVGVTTITYTVKDASGNAATCSFTVTVSDNINPVISCPANINQAVTAGCSKNISVPDPVFSDNCTATTLTWSISGVTTGQSPLTGINLIGSRVFNVGITTVSYVVKDAAGNSASCSFTVTVTDNINPTINCPGNLNQKINSGCSTGIATTDPSYSDNCAVSSLTWIMSGATTGNSPATGFNFVGTQKFNVGLTRITYSVTDAAGNLTSCSFTINVKDNIKPTITCPPNPVLCMEATNNYSIAPLIASDNCSIALVTYSITGATTRSGTGNDASGFFNTGVSNIKWNVTDASGNSSNCTTKVTISAIPCIPPFTKSAPVAETKLVYHKPGVVIFPNPTSNSVSVVSNSKTDIINLKVTNMNGATLINNYLFTASTAINLSAYPAGTYNFILTNQTSGVTITRTVVKL